MLLLFLLLFYFILFYLCQTYGKYLFLFMNSKLAAYAFLPLVIFGFGHSTILLTTWPSCYSHTRPGSLKVSIYDGAKNAASSATLTTDMCELAATDIVLTTYDVLREDLSHDSDRHDGDRRFMRFMKKYAPFLLFMRSFLCIFLKLFRS